MIPRRSRLKVSSFPRTAPFLHRAPGFSLKFTPNNLAYNRYGVIIPAAAVRSAAARHRLKRRLLALAVKLPAAGRDLLFLVRKDQTWQELQMEFAKMINNK